MSRRIRADERSRRADPRSGGGARGLWMVVALVAGSATADAAERLVHRRSGLTPVAIERASSSPDGLRVLRIDRGLDREEIIPWDLVARIDPDPETGALEVGLDRGLLVGDRLWRGRIRLQRGDARLAAEAFDEALAQLPSWSGATASQAIEGAVAAAVAMGRSVAVLPHAVFLGDLARAGRRSDRFRSVAFAGDIVDPALFLVPEAPPVLLVDDRASLELRRRLRELPTLDDTATVRRDLWLRLLEGRPAPEDLPDRGLDPGTRFLADLADLDAADETRRDRARRRLVTDLDEAPAWRIAWVRHRLGRARLECATTDDQRFQGVLDLVQVLALEDAAPPVLRLDAARRSATALRELGRTDDADFIESLMLIEFPDRTPTETTS